MASRDHLASRIGIVIVNYNTRDLLDACLKSLALALGIEGRAVVPDSLRITTPTSNRAADRVAGLGIEVWVVDNASSDGSADLVAAHHPWVKLERLDHNVGFTAANNIVLRRWLEGSSDTPEQVLLLNPDTEVSPAAIATLCDVLDANPSLGLVGPALVYPDGRFQHAAFRFPGVVQTVLDLWPVDRLTDSPINGRYQRSSYEAGVPFDVDFVLGACMLMRGAALRAIGPLDEQFFMYCEEIDWCLRVRADGWRIACAPAAVVIHHGGASTDQFRSTSFVHLWRSRRRLARKHFSTWRRFIFEAVLSAGLLSRSRADRIAVRRGRLDEVIRIQRLEAFQAIKDYELPA